MNIQPKSPELVQAQIAAFAMDGLESTNDGREVKEVFDHIGSLAAGEVTDHEFSREHVKRNSADGPNGISITRHTVRGADYVEHLRKTQGSHNESVRERTPYLEAYGRFRPHVSGLIEELRRDPAARQHHDALVGAGVNAQAFGVSIEGTDYIVKMATGDKNGALPSEGRRMQLAPGKGIAHLEQLVAISYEDGVAIMERMPGTELDKTPIETIKNVTDAQFSEALDTIRNAYEAGLSFDPKPSNYFYDPKEGFGFIDYHTRVFEPTPKSIDEMTGDCLANALAFAGTQFPAGLKSHDDYLTNGHEAVIKVDLFRRLREVCLVRPDVDQFTKTIAGIDQKLESLHAFVANINTPGWVDAEVRKSAQDRKLRLQDQAERARLIADGRSDPI